MYNSTYISCALCRCGGVRARGYIAVKAIFSEGFTETLCTGVYTLNALKLVNYQHCITDILEEI